MRWFQALMPREERFFALFGRHAETIANGAEALRDVLKGGEGAALAGQRVMDFEAQADAITRDVLLLMRRSFITPFDRGGIKDLIGTLDDSIDQMQKTAKAIRLFEVESFEPERDIRISSNFRTAFSRKLTVYGLSKSRFYGSAATSFGKAWKYLCL